MQISILVACPCANGGEGLLDSLRAAGHSVLATGSVSEAMTLVTAATDGGSPFEVFVICAQLEDGSGADLLDGLVEHGQTTTPVIWLEDPESARAEPHQDRFPALIRLPTGVAASQLMAALKRLVASAWSSSSPSERPRTGRPRILVVDDHPLGRQMVCTVLEKFSAQVSSAADGQEALDRVRSEDFDLILMDIQMPVMNGLEATRAIRQLADRRFQQLPILAMTTEMMNQERQDCLRAGMSGTIDKPIEIRQLYSELTRWLPLIWPGEDQDPGADEDELQALLPAIEVAAGIRRSGGKRSAYLDLLRKFSRQFRNLETELRHCKETQSWADAGLILHGYRGVIGNLGGQQLFHLARQVENDLKNGQADQLDELLAGHRSLLEALERLPVRTDPPLAPSSQRGADRDWRELLAELIEPLNNLQAREVNRLLSCLREVPWPAAQAEDLRRLIESLEQYNYGQSAQLITELRQKCPSGDF